MLSKQYFIRASENYNTFENSVPAYYFRRSFHSDHPAKAKITVAVCGFYELYFNGTKITKGFLSPYINNTNDYIRKEQLKEINAILSDESVDLLDSQIMRTLLNCIKVIDKHTVEFQFNCNINIIEKL